MRGLWIGCGRLGKACRSLSRPIGPRRAHSCIAPELGDCRSSRMRALYNTRRKNPAGLGSGGWSAATCWPRLFGRGRNSFYAHAARLVDELGRAPRCLPCGRGVGSVQGRRIGASLLYHARIAANNRQRTIKEALGTLLWVPPLVRMRRTVLIGHHPDSPTAPPGVRDTTVFLAVRHFRPGLIGRCAWSCFSEGRLH